MISDLNKHAAMPSDLLDACQEHGHVHAYQHEEIVHTRGELKLGLSIILRGAVKIGNYGIDGNYQHTITLKPGDTFGEFTLFNDLPRTHHAQSVGVTEIIQMSTSQFQRCAQHNPDLQMYLIKAMGYKLHTALVMLDDAQRLSTHVRLAKMLLEYSDTDGVVALRQKDLAELLGLSVLSGHKALQKLVTLGLVTSAYGKVNICDVNELQAWIAPQCSLGALRR